jgi:type VI secretion system secreted protein Hcp
MRNKLVLAAVVLAVLWCVPVKPAQYRPPMPLAAGGPVGQGMPTNLFFVEVTGQKSGLFPNEILVKPPVGMTKAVEGIRFYYQESLATGPTGMATARRQFSPITFTKVWGASSPIFANALSTNENITKVTFEFSHQKITLTGAHITSIRRYIGVPSGTEPADSRELEDISFTFQKITVDDTIGNTTASDDWNAPV